MKKSVFFVLISVFFLSAGFAQVSATDANATLDPDSNTKVNWDKEVYDMGGITDWTAEGFPVVK